MPPKDARFKQQHLKNLGERTGRNNKVWDEFIRMAAQYEDREIMAALFRARVRETGQPLAQYRYDLFSVFRANPGFFAQSAHDHFGGNLDCAVDLLVPQSQVLAFHDVEAAAKRATKNPATEGMLDKFMVRAREHHARLASNQSDLKLDTCWKP